MGSVTGGSGAGRCDCELVSVLRPEWGAKGTESSGDKMKSLQVGGAGCGGQEDQAGLGLGRAHRALGARTGRPEGTQQGR